MTEGKMLTSERELLPPHLRRGAFGKEYFCKWIKEEAPGVIVFWVSGNFTPQTLREWLNFHWEDNFDFAEIDADALKPVETTGEYGEILSCRVTLRSRP